MIYVALLRGINVGGKNKVNMAQLKGVFEQVGTQDVTTYINSGNIIFRDDTRGHQELVKLLEKAIQTEFGFAVKVLVRDLPTLRAIAQTMPKVWKNDADMKCDVMFLWENFDKPDVVKSLTIKPDIDNVKYVRGAVVWSVDRKNATRSGLMKIFGTELYAHMTIRNCNTTRKLLELMEQAAKNA